MSLASGVAARARMEPHSLARYRSEFPIFRDKIYLNTCSLGALGDRTRRKVAEYLDLWQARGASAWYDVWWAALGELRTRYGRLVDAFQAVGQLPVGAHATGVDFLTAGGLKWLLGGPGIVFLYVREELAARLEPTVAGWFSHREQFSFDPRALALHDDARRFELGTPALAAIYAQLGGLEYVEEIGVPAIRTGAAGLAEGLIARAMAGGVRPEWPPPAAERSA